MGRIQAILSGNLSLRLQHPAIHTHIHTHTPTITPTTAIYTYNTYPIPAIYTHTTPIKPEHCRERNGVWLDCVCGEEGASPHSEGLRAAGGCQEHWTGQALCGFGGVSFLELESLIDIGPNADHVLYPEVGTLPPRPQVRRA